MREDIGKVPMGPMLTPRNDLQKLRVVSNGLTGLSQKLEKPCVTRKEIAKALGLFQCRETGV